MKYCVNMYSISNTVQNWIWCRILIRKLIICRISIQNWVDGEFWMVNIQVFDIESRSTLCWIYSVNMNFLANVDSMSNFNCESFQFRIFDLNHLFLSNLTHHWFDFEFQPKFKFRSKTDSMSNFNKKNWFEIELWSE